MKIIKFKYVVREYLASSFYGEEEFSELKIGIGFKLLDDDFIYPSPLTNFIKSTVQRKGKSYNTQHTIASEITKFLNYCIENIESNSEFQVLKDQGLFGLNLMHGSEYITHYTIKAKKEEIKPEYVYRIEGFLIRFYRWLDDQQIISLPEVKSYSKESGSFFDDIELGTLYPPKKEGISQKIVDFGKNRIQLAITFLKIAEVEAPDIALGVAFQFFGGLRRSEVVNLILGSIDGFRDNELFQGKVIILKVRDNQELLFTNNLNHTKEQVKKPRNQSVLSFQIVKEMLGRHQKNLNLLKKKDSRVNKYALFIDYKTGQPITGLQYYRRFNKIKEAFLTQLSNDNHIDFDFLNNHQWSTHIGRGVFTNILLQRGADVITTSIARGDRSIHTVIKYVDENKSIEFTQQTIDYLNQGLEKEKVKKAYNDGNSIIPIDISMESDEGEWNE